MKRVQINTEYKDYTKFNQFIHNLPSLFDKQGKTLYQERNTIKLFEIDGLSFVVKRFKRPLLVQRIAYSFFRPTKVSRAYQHAHLLRLRGFETPQEMASVEVWKNGLFQDGYLATEVITDNPIAHLLAREDETFSEKLAEQFAYFVADLHLKGILHEDLNSTNVLYREQNGKVIFSLIDINRMTFYPEGKVPSQKDCLNNLNRFTGNYSLFEFVTRAYARKRGWNEDEIAKEALNMKETHDVRRIKKKNFFKKFKRNKSK